MDISMLFATNETLDMHHVGGDYILEEGIHHQNG
jgi:hypothetical protein